ncbi:hypothetical protein CH375_04550 [Leptospira ellisii]|uniref:Uncharacterized protein n=1 Tax=Leptospira ellisii TaxID=2023197 RepID=A0A2N0BBN5_9LEPT|nr:hypothetical protein CH379_05245 [Leptospira ellisii]PKA05542.1 hypothetical protein CH375_04550 [Leptospira ellisii]
MRGEHVRRKVLNIYAYYVFPFSLGILPIVSVRSHRSRTVNSPVPLFASRKMVSQNPLLR